MFYDSFSATFLALVFWWAILLAFKRYPSRYPNNNTWKKDIFITFIQSIVSLIVFAIINYYY
ncbi:hypothetical protein [Litchfieldia salsa]|uniref:Uncharacterized protein n=1 Tax=Litchfieldia salsa TaxID=930152 RepID=A0A1H0SW87_9BACI|nr:hypothetical protein [Litchfieldia salsa]SDP45905.1 hypothetical protein SAMN05216565_103149 [Litchfieldia salsa]